MSLTIADIMASYENEYPRRVHRQRRIPFRGESRHHYFVRRELTPRELARVTNLSGPSEVSLVQFNRAFIVSIGGRGFAEVGLIFPTANDQVSRFRWIAHTHPLEFESRYNRVSRGPSCADWIAAKLLSDRFGQRESLVVVCRGGRVVELRGFPLNPLNPLGVHPADECTETESSGEIWQPGP